MSMTISSRMPQLTILLKPLGVATPSRLAADDACTQARRR